MAEQQEYGTGRMRISLGRTMEILRPYISSRFMEQLKGIWFIVLYLVLFQILVLRLPIVYSLMIGLGLFIVLLGLMFFIEGLLLGLMPFGEAIGSKLPQRSTLPVILLFAFLLGMGVTFAEPAIAVLKQAGSGVKPWQAPLLYSLLNDFSGQLVFSVGAGVGVAVLLGVLRFMYNWSLKVLIVPLVIILGVITFWAHVNDILNPIIGLAWDCGGVTTGPVTVPLVLALGIGVSRIVGTGENSSAGFGIVTLASLFPIIAVLMLGFIHYYADDYYGRPNYKGEVISQTAGTGAVLSKESTRKFTPEEFELFKQTGKIDAEYSISYERSRAKLVEGKVVIHGPVVVFEKPVTGGVKKDKVPQWDRQLSIIEQVKAATLASLQAIIPLCIFLFLTLRFILREKVTRGDEISLGILFAVIGMGLFGLGIILGLTPLGGQLGSNVPAAFASIQPWGLQGFQGPLYGAGFSGKMVAVIFAFFLGYGATLAEPALNALGITVEKITVGAFKKSLLMNTVAIGVGLGIAVGILKIAYNLPLFWLLIPPYIVLIFITLISSEDFVNFGWDSAGVTTGPITVPLVLAMGLGVGSQVPGVIDGFGVLALASVYPIITVLAVGLFVSRQKKKK